MSVDKCIDPKMGALLHAYELDTLSAEDMDRFESHLLICDSCFNSVNAFNAPAEVLVSDKRIINEISRAVESTNGPASFAKRLKNYLWPDLPLILRPAVAYGLILLLLFPAYVGLISLIVDNSKIHPAQTINLTPTRSIWTERFDINLKFDGVINFLIPWNVIRRSYQVIIRNEEGLELMHNQSFDNFDKNGSARLVFPRRLMKPGKYILFITDNASDSFPQTYEYHFDIIE